MEKDESPYAGYQEVTDRSLIFHLFLVFLCLSITGCAAISGSLFIKDPLTAEEHNNLGVIYEGEGKYELALKEYNSALDKDRSLVVPLVNMGNVYLKQYEYKQAEKYYKKALKKDKHNIEAANNLASLYTETGGDYEEGLEYMNTATENMSLIPPYALDTMGVLYLRQGNRGKAKELLLSACENAGDDEKLLKEIASHLNDTEEGLTCR